MNCFQGKRTVGLGLLLALLPLSRSDGVLFVSTGDPSVNTNAPTGSLANSGWQYEGQWNIVLGTAIAPHFFLAAQHVNGAVGQTFELNGVTYHTVAFFDEPGTDLRLWQVAETFPSFAPLYTTSDEVGKQCVVFGRGTERGPAITIGKLTNGWLWGDTNNIERWGENVVTGVTTNGGVGPLLFANFNGKGIANECDLSYNDSSGGLFIKQGTTWKLAGVHYSVDGPFSQDGTANTQFDAALTDLRGLYFRVGINGWELVPTNNPVAVPTSFYSSRISVNIDWINSVINFVPGSELQITSGPAATNAVSSFGDTTVVRPGDTVGFAVGAISTNGNPVTCAWDFGNGDTSTNFNPSEVFTNCGAFAVSVTLTDAVMSVTTGLTVAVACPMTVSSFKLQAKFTKVGADACSVSGTLPNLATNVSLANAVVTLDVGDAAFAFTLNAKGKGSSKSGSLTVSINKKSGLWTYTGKLKGDMHGAWSNHGVTSAVVTNNLVTVPVVVLLQLDTLQSFESEPGLSYTCKNSVSGTGTLAP
jgi:hypothetical protein